MTRKSKYRKAGDNETIAITDLATMRFKMLKPRDGIIEIVNSLGHGRICALKISDFRSRKEAELIAGLLRLAPELLQVNNNKTDRLDAAFRRIVVRMKSIEAAQKKVESRFTEQRNKSK